MSVSLYYSLPKTKKPVGGDYVSSDVFAIKTEFGLELDESCLPRLRAMFRASERPVYERLIALIEKHEEIELHEEY